VSEEDIDVLISAEESVEVWEPEPLYIEAPAPIPAEFEEDVEEGGQVIIIDIAGEEE
jgi:hypothetical protein